MVRLKATAINPYHKTDSIVEVDESASKHLIEKGYFVLASAAEKKPLPEEDKLKVSDFENLIEDEEKKDDESNKKPAHKKHK